MCFTSKTKLSLGLQKRIKSNILHSTKRYKYKRITTRAATRRTYRFREQQKKKMGPVRKLSKTIGFNCEKCNEFLSSIEEFEEHSKIHEHIFSAYVFLERLDCNPFTCKDCEMQFNSSRECNTHELQNFSPRKKNVCNINVFDKPLKHGNYSARFGLQSNFSQHSKVHKPFPHVCHCGIGYYRLVSLERHIKLVHTSKNIETVTETETSTEKPSYTGPKLESDFVKSAKPEPQIKYKTDSEESKYKSDMRPSGDLKTEQGTRPKLLQKIKAKSKNETRKLINKQANGTKKTKFKMSNDNYDGTFSCTLCKETFRNRIYVINHYKTIHLGEKYPCEFCSKEFDLKSKIVNHVQRFHSRKYICPHCDKGFGSISLFKAHTLIHVKNRERVVCKECNKTFVNKVVLNTHTNEVHRNIRNHICQYCKKAFKNRSKLKLHERIHSGYKPYKCTYCHKEFSDPSAFKRHTRTHTGDKIYACEKCPMRFTDASGLIAHRLRHTGVRNFKCEICDKAFFSRTALKNHVVSVHTRLRKFECFYCGEKTTLKTSLVVHMQRMHRRELGLKRKPFECDYCCKLFSFKKYLTYHIFTVHRKELGLQCRPFECHHCGCKKSSKGALSLHIHQLHAKEFGKTPKYVECPHCRNGKTYPFHQLSSHINKAHGNNVFECYYCGEKKSRKKYLETHIYQLHRVAAGLKKLNLNCFKCKKEFGAKPFLDSHIRYMHGVVVYCNICGRQFRSPEGLVKHKNKCVGKKKVH